MVMPTLSTVREETFRAIHQPHGDLNVAGLIEGLRSLRRSLRGQLFIEVMLLAGYNDRDEEIEALRRVILGIAPDRVQLNTVVRPPADAKAIPLDRKKLEYIKRVSVNAQKYRHSTDQGKAALSRDLVGCGPRNGEKEAVTVEDVAGALDAPSSKWTKP